MAGHEGPLASVDLGFPVPWRPYVRALVRQGQQVSAVPEMGDGLTDCLVPHVEYLGQLLLGQDLAARWPVAGDDALAHDLRDLDILLIPAPPLAIRSSHDDACPENAVDPAVRAVETG